MKNIMVLCVFCVLMQSCMYSVRITHAKGSENPATEESEPVISVPSFEVPGVAPNLA